MTATRSAGFKLALGGGLGLLVLAQASGGPGYNLGIPVVPGTRTPESNPATMVTPPSYGPSSAPSPGAGNTGSDSGAAAPATPGTASGPGYSFGAAPPPITSPGR